MTFDWTRDDALAFRLMIDNRIELEFRDNWFAMYWDGSSWVEAGNSNPNRAICECYLLMKDAER